LKSNFGKNSNDTKKKIIGELKKIETKKQESEIIIDEIN
jgi:hypothetical protein